jgi:aspartyl aminopeptidase
MDLIKHLQHSHSPAQVQESLTTLLQGLTVTDIYDDIKSKTDPGIFRSSTDNRLFLAKGSGPIHRLNFVGTHGDWPTFKIKPHYLIKKDGETFWNVEPYGGLVGYTWFDRTLGVSGRLYYTDANQQTQSQVIDLPQVAVIPSLPIHLNREVNDRFKVNFGNDTFPFVLQPLEPLIQEKYQITSAQILSYDLNLYDTQEPVLIQGYYHAQGLDNLVSVYAGIEAFLSSKPQPGVLNIYAVYHHEEVGSNSSEGAKAYALRAFLEQVLSKIDPKANLERLLSQAVFLSCDACHGYHPQYSALYDHENRIRLGQGLALKYNYSTSYSTSAKGAAYIKSILQKNEVTYQEITNVSGGGGGSTIGPHLAASLGVEVVDLGVPLLAMHSTRELGSEFDAHQLLKLLKGYYESH